jgi:iron complex transport system substrate-binding protein
MSDSNYSELTAVKEGNVYTIDTNLLDRQGYRNAEGVKELAEIFHPEVFE